MSANLTNACPSHVRWVVLGGTILWSLLGLLGALPAMFACMMFDAPGSTENVPTIALVGAVASFPIVCAMAVIQSQVSRRAGEFAKACWFACLPLANVLVGAVAAGWIELVQAGRLA